MTFLWPEMLWFFVLVPLLVATWQTSSAVAAPTTGGRANCMLPLNGAPTPGRAGRR